MGSCSSILFFFIKQKTAYEMRISDWSSDVCSSDLCHSTVDDSFAPGIGHRRDGWPNLDLNPGAIIALSPALSDAQKAQLNSWGPGKYDPRWHVDGLSVPVVIPPAYCLAGVDSVVFTGDGNNLP